MNDKNDGVLLYILKDEEDREMFIQDVYDTDDIRRKNNYQYKWRSRFIGEYQLMLNMGKNLITATELLKALMSGGKLYAYTLTK